MRHCSLSARTREAAKSHCPRSWDEDRLLGNHFAPSARVVFAGFRWEPGEKIKARWKIVPLRPISGSLVYSFVVVTLRSGSAPTQFSTLGRGTTVVRFLTGSSIIYLSDLSIERTTGGTTEVELKWSNPIAIEGCFSPPTSRRFKT